MHEYTVLRSAVENLGAVCVEEHLHPEAFGSAHCLFKCGDGEFRLVWDGKEGYGFLQIPSDRPGGWSDVGPYVSGVSNPKATKFALFLQTAKALVHGSVV